MLIVIDLQRSEEVDKIFKTYQVLPDHIYYSAGIVCDVYCDSE
jgi:hypothetical protein